MILPQICQARAAAQEPAPTTGTFKDNQVPIADLSLLEKHRRVLPETKQRSVQTGRRPRGASLEVRSTDMHYFQCKPSFEILSVTRRFILV
jgi:hypothetical protein